MYRNTYVEINLKNIESNVKKLINIYSNYKYYFGVVKADCYGHKNINTVRAIINGGCNYLAVATLEEALEIRKDIHDIPILCLGIIPVEFIDECIKNNITITISNIDYLKKVILKKHVGLKVHIKLNTGMNRLGTNNKNEFNEMYSIVKNSNLFLEGLYTHIYNASSVTDTRSQFDKFEAITSDIDLAEVPIVHLCASDATILYSKLHYANGCRFGIAMYGLSDSNDSSFLSTFSLHSEIIQINDVPIGSTVGYNGSYIALGTDNNSDFDNVNNVANNINNIEKIAVIPIGYADGIIRKNTGRSVFINDKSYNIVGNICMDMLFVKVDSSVKVGDKVTLIKDISHIQQIANYLDTIPYEVICSISQRVPRIYR